MAQGGLLGYWRSRQAARGRLVLGCDDCGGLSKGNIQHMSSPLTGCQYKISRATRHQVEDIPVLLADYRGRTPLFGLNVLVAPRLDQMVVVLAAQLSLFDVLAGGGSLGRLVAKEDERRCNCTWCRLPCGAVCCCRV